MALFNRAWVTQTLSIDFATLGVKGRRFARDVWAQKDLGAYDNRFSTEVHGHATRLIRLR